MKRFIQFGDRITAENEAVRKAIQEEGVVSHYKFGPMPSWMRWLDSRIPRMNENWRDHMFVEKENKDG